MKLLLLFALSVSFFMGSGQDNPDCSGKTFTFFTTFDGFYIERCEESEFKSYTFELDGASRMIEKKGRYREVWFRKKAGSNRRISGLQIIQNHVNAIMAVKGEVVKGSGDGIYQTMYQGNELWIHLKVYSGNQDVDNFAIISIESAPMKQEISARNIQGSMDSQGKMALYGVYFDTGKSDIKVESERELKEVAMYLQDNPSISVYIVGHTDNAGDAGVNLALSKRRGEAVKQFLIARHKIDPGRLTGDGVGQLCPVASNDNEAGRKLNRRVEIVRK